MVKKSKYCSGNAKADKCTDKKRDFNEWWETIKNWEPLRTRINEDDRYNTETVRMFSFPKEATKHEIHHWIVHECNVNCEEDQILSTTTPNVWLLIHVGLDNVTSVINRLQGRKFAAKKFINCVPLTQLTPVRRSRGIRTHDGRRVDTHDPQAEDDDGETVGEPMHHD